MAAQHSNSSVRQRKTKEDEKVVVEEDDIPDDVKAVKEKLERETGKKYRYRDPKKDLPSVAELLRQGSGKPWTWKEKITYSVALAFLFGITLFIFHHVVLVPSYKAKLEGRGRKPYTLPKMSPRK